MPRRAAGNRGRSIILSPIEEIKRLLERCTDEQCQEILDHLRQRIAIHPIEAKFNTRAEIILEAIDRASDLTQRGIKGIIAEAAFSVCVGKLEGWRDVTPPGDLPFDFLLEDQVGQVRVQVKMQRRKTQRPMMANEASRLLSPDMFVVETQRTRGGTDRETGEDTRPYRFGEFDILAVSMHASTNNWESFMYTVGDWLLPREENGRLLSKYQPVAPVPNDDWTDNILTSVGWLRSGINKQIKA